MPSKQAKTPKNRGNSRHKNSGGQGRGVFDPSSTLEVDPMEKQEQTTQAKAPTLEEIIQAAVHAEKDSEAKKKYDNIKAYIGKQTRAAIREDLPMYERYTSKWAENKYYDKLRMARDGVLTGVAGFTLYKVGRWVYEWFRS